VATVDPEVVAGLDDELIKNTRAELKAIDEVFEYEQYRRMAIKAMTPDQMARACDIARDRIVRAPDAETKAVLTRFIRDIELEGARRFPGRQVAGRLDIGVEAILKGIGIG